MIFSGLLMKAVDFVASANLCVLAKCALRPIEPAIDRALEEGCHEDHGETKWGIGQVLPADQWGLEQSMGCKGTGRGGRQAENRGPGKSTISGKTGSVKGAPLELP